MWSRGFGRFLILFLVSVIAGKDIGIMQITFILQTNLPPSFSIFSFALTFLFFVTPLSPLPFVICLNKLTITAAPVSTWVHRAPAYAILHIRSLSRCLLFMLLPPHQSSCHLVFIVRSRPSLAHAFIFIAFELIQFRCWISLKYAYFYISLKFA